MIRLLIISLLTMSLSGCYPPGSGRTTDVDEKPKQKQTATGNGAKSLTGRVVKSPMDRANRNKGLGLSAKPPEQEVLVPAIENGDDVQPGTRVLYPEIRRLLESLEESEEFAPTLVVWVLDRSASCTNMVVSVTTQLGYFYQKRSKDFAEGNEGSLLTSVVSFGDDVQVHTESPTKEPAVVMESLSSIVRAQASEELAFAAVDQAIDIAFDYRVKQNHEVMIVVVTDEAGNDQQLVDEVIERPAKYAMPVFVVGVGAPLGRTSIIPASVEGGNQESQNVILQGPESRQREMLSINDGFLPDSLTLFSSGFGPFAWEMLCRKTGGAFMPVKMPGYTAYMLRRPGGGGFLVGEYEPGDMKKYIPDYINEADYQQLLTENKARAALNAVAKRPALETLNNPRLDFEVQSEVQLSRDLSASQQGAAQLEPQVREVYEILKQAEADSAKLTRPRWQAGYDLAMGRVSAVLARVEGYNAMLALLKRGRSFENAASSRWALVPGDSSQAGSAIKRTAEQAKTYLEKVVKEHPGTPWARLAELELQQPIGWAWEER